MLNTIIHELIHGLKSGKTFTALLYFILIKSQFTEHGNTGQNQTCHSQVMSRQTDRYMCIYLYTTSSSCQVLGHGNCYGFMSSLWWSSQTSPLYAIGSFGLL